ncbi:sigma-54 dependent transcriptional regulator [Marinobacterium jannaschii]|uniref:sigma-54 dependent transcriptional regulator n=1 Tax=Marinobacterium jannaschii TaxID=64970 RepID=UPI00055E54CE|nr:sigma-54 dependent transcriptional regulator [Marinobacterium jannaschii]
MALTCEEARPILYICPSSQPFNLCEEIEATGWQVDTVDSVGHARRRLEEDTFYVGLIHLDGLEEEELWEIEELVAASRMVTWVALVSSDALVSGHICRLIQNNFVDYYTLPITGCLDSLIATLGHAWGMAKLTRKAQSQDPYASYEMVGSSPVMRDLFTAIRKVASVGAPVLITGESGTGKELIARAVHERSLRSEGAFVAVNCGALPDNLIHSELFGYEKGAFTGATQRKQGWIELASGGTLFLDEIGDLPLELQVNLLRFLQEGTIQRVGGTEAITVDVRVIAATHVDLNKAIEEGRYREDLYYRLNVLNLQSPPLREREGDIELLAQFFFKHFGGEAGRDIRGYTRKALVAMNQHLWPGNVRELINRVRRALVMCDGRMISPADLGLDASHPLCEEILTLEEARLRAEKNSISRALFQAKNNVSEAARQLGVSRVTLYRLMHKHGLEENSEAS